MLKQKSTYWLLGASWLHPRLRLPLRGTPGSQSVSEWLDCMQSPFWPVLRVDQRLTTATCTCKAHRAHSLCDGRDVCILHLAGTSCLKQTMRATTCSSAHGAHRLRDGRDVCILHLARTSCQKVTRGRIHVWQEAPACTARGVGID